MGNSNQPAQRNGMTKKMLRRSLVFMLLFLIVAFLIVIVRLGIIMLADSDFYQSKALSQQLRDTVIEPQRGTIYDRNMKPLAQSATVWTVYVSPADLKEEERDIVADGLSEILGVDRQKIYDAVCKKTYYEIIKRQVENDVADKVRTFAVEKKLTSAIGLDVSTKRYYPNNNFASTVLGFVGTDNNGLSGIEAYYDKDLAGEEGRVIAAKNARGADMPFTYEKMVDAKNGNSLVLTIDEVIQYFVEKHLDIAVKEDNVESRAACVVMDVKTGDILAMATKPDFDPNSPFEIYDEKAKAAIEQLEGDERKAAVQKEQQAQWRNKVVSDTYEPGSVFKIVTGSAAYEQHVVTESSTFHCPGYIVIGGRKIKCHKTQGHGTLNLPEAFINSCNPSFIQMGQNLGAEQFYNYFKAFGLIERTGIDLPGEADSIYYTADKMGVVELASESFGQTFNISPIQLVTAVSCVANGGQLMQPRLVKQIVDENGNIVKNYEPTVKRQVISQSTATAICNMLEQVVSVGSGKNAKVTGYKIAGKTGTSEKISQNLATGKKKYIASFCGFAPADDPQIAILLLLDEPNTTSYYGGTLAAPVVGEMFEEILPYLGIDPQYTEEELAQLDVSVPPVDGKTTEGAKTEIKNAGLEVTVIGSGDTVLKQVPAGGLTMPKGGTVVLYTEENTENTQVTVPDLTGVSVTEANRRAINAGLNIKLSGSGLEQSGAVSYRQSIDKDTKVDKGTLVTVYFRYSDNVE